MEILTPIPTDRPKLKVALFDFDGTISTIRQGWEAIMEPLMAEMISGPIKPEPELITKIKEYIDQSTGIQTIYQMQWLAEQVKAYGRNKNVQDDPWWYKAEYNRRILELVNKRIDIMKRGEKTRSDFMMKGSEEFLKALKANGVQIYVASGTDHVDVIKEVDVLGLTNYFTEIAGAPMGKVSCSKEMVIRKLITEKQLKGQEVVVIGDGKVEIALGREVGTLTIGVATDEVHLCGLNPVKRARLVKAGANIIIPDFQELSEILNWLGLQKIQEKPSKEAKGTKIIKSSKKSTATKKANSEEQSINPLLSKNVKIPGQLDFANIKMYSVKNRINLVTLQNMAKPGVDAIPNWTAPDFDKLIDCVVEARKAGHPVVWFQGAHVIKNGLSRYIIELVKRGIVTHVAGNGAGSIHDFELAYNGGTSEDVPTAIEDGSFGMWEETGRWMNEALQNGAKKSMGYGESLAVYIDENPTKFPNKEDCVFYQCYKHNVPATYHIALGTDIIHQHPIVDFGAIGVTSGIDFHKFCHTIAQLDKGVFMNFGSSVLGPEVFLKALSISRNLGFQTFDITTANFDILNLGDYKCKIGYDDPHYYYRPRKNIVNRPTQQSKRGWHFVGDHKDTIPNLYTKIISKLPSIGKK